MVLLEVYIGLVTDPLPPIIQAIVVDNLIFIVRVITEAEIGLTPENVMHIIMVD